MAYHMFVNPSGIQMDALQTRNEDAAVDWVWQSAGRWMRRATRGSAAAAAEHPLQGRPRRADGRAVLSPEQPHGHVVVVAGDATGEWVFENHAQLSFGELHQPRLLEVIPSATLSRNDTRVAGQPWQASRRKADFGASVKYGITSTVTLDATINPDFSQVESDAFEVEVNNRFPIFFSEKRPFFMEGLGLFNLAGTNGDATCARRSTRGGSWIRWPASSSPEPPAATPTGPS
jgi:hypothetical protein